MFKFTRGHCLDDWQRKLWDAAQEELKERVLELHYEYPDTGDCAGCDHIYPCPTIKALDGEQE
jgi:hypothetical protein